MTGSSRVAGHCCFGRTSFQYFWGRREWGWDVSVFCRKCHKSDQGAQVDYQSFEKGGGDISIIQAHCSDELRK